MADFTSISPKTNFKYLDAFSDSEGNLNTDFPRSVWNVNFSEQGNSTFVDIIIKHEKLSDLEIIIQMASKKVLPLQWKVWTRFLPKMQNK